MRPELKLLIDEYNSKLSDYESFVNENNWLGDLGFRLKSGFGSSLLETEIQIITTVLDIIDDVKSEAGIDIDTATVKKIFKRATNIVEIHLERIDQFNMTDYFLSDEGDDDEDLEGEAIGKVNGEIVMFDAKLAKHKVKVKTKLVKVGAEEQDTNKSMHLFNSDKKASLFMQPYITEVVPITRKKWENLAIPSLDVTQSNEMFINMKKSDIPEWDSTKHFFEQNTSTIQFWQEEIRKINEGINIWGYQLSPWLYWHLNHMHISQGSGKDQRLAQPILRDNEYYFDEMYKQAENHGRVGLLLYGSRRWSKSTSIASKIMHLLYTIPRAKGSMLGFSYNPDLDTLLKYLIESMEGIHPALSLPIQSSGESGIDFGLQAKGGGIKYIYSTLTAINLGGGVTKSSTQKTAGSKPDVYCMDEIGKGKCIAPWQAAIPSFAGGKDGKWRCTPILSGTAGEEALSVDAEKLLKNPSAYDIMPMNWDTLESFVDPEFITWRRSTFGMFLPAQMSIEPPVPKIKTNLADFLKIEDNEGLKQLEIQVTDWKGTKEYFEGQREAKSVDINSLASYTNSFPLDPEDCYITTEVNKFPGMQCKLRKKHIEEKGEVGQRVWLVKNFDQITKIQALEPTVDVFPYEGGSVNAPIVMFDDPYTAFSDPPPLGLYVIGLDDVKQDVTSGNSLASATVYKRGYEGGEWANRIVAYYDSRPDKKVDFYRNLYLLVKYYNAMVLHENADNGFVEWMEQNHMDEMYHFSDGIGLAIEENLHRNKNRKYGWSPTAQNIYNLENRIVAYLQQDNVVLGEHEGLSGVDLVNHPMLLEEFYKYKKGGNYDRIRSFGLALSLAQYYDKLYLYIKKRSHIRRDGDVEFKKKKNLTINGLPNLTLLKPKKYK